MVGISCLLEKGARVNVGEEQASELLLLRSLLLLLLLALEARACSRRGEISTDLRTYVLARGRTV